MVRVTRRQNSTSQFVVVSRWPVSGPHVPERLEVTYVLPITPLKGFPVSDKPPENHSGNADRIHDHHQAGVCSIHAVPSGRALQAVVSLKIRLSVIKWITGIRL